MAKESKHQYVGARRGVILLILALACAGFATWIAVTPIPNGVSPISALLAATMFQLSSTAAVVLCIGSVIVLIRARFIRDKKPSSENS